MLRGEKCLFNKGGSLRVKPIENEFVLFQKDYWKGGLPTFLLDFLFLTLHDASPRIMQSADRTLSTVMLFVSSVCLQVVQPTGIRSTEKARFCQGETEISHDRIFNLNVLTIRLTRVRRQSLTSCIEDRCSFSESHSWVAVPRATRLAVRRKRPAPAATKLTALEDRQLMAWKRNSALGSHHRSSMSFCFPSDPCTAVGLPWICFPSNLRTTKGHKLCFLHLCIPPHDLFITCCNL